MSLAWEQIHGRPRSFSGTRLEGNRLVRFIYLDEAGISEDEPVVVVAGVLVDGDRQFGPLEAYHTQIVEEYVPKDMRHNFEYFHAKTLANGEKQNKKGTKIFVRGEYPEERRLEALRRLSAIPAQFMLPVVFGYLQKHPETPRHAGLPYKRKVAYQQASAFSYCVVAAEKFMRDRARVGEVALCVAEDNSDARRIVKAAHMLLKNPRSPEILADREISKVLPLRRIVDTVHFATKTEAVLLQIADVCAYVVKRYLTKAPYADELFRLMTNENPLPHDRIKGRNGSHYFAPYNASRVETGQAWLASKLVQSSPD